MHYRKMKDIVFFNGKFIPACEAQLPATTAGILSGAGCFETMRAYRGHIVYLREHLARIKNSARALDIRLAYSAEELKKIIFRVIACNGCADSYTRLTIFNGKGKYKLLNTSSRQKSRDPDSSLKKIVSGKIAGSYRQRRFSRSISHIDTLVEVKNYIPYPARKYNTGFAACLSSLRQNEGSFLVQHKTTNRLIYQLALSEAARKNCDEAVILNNRGYLAEGSRSNIFFTQGRALYTPALACGCLGGITRKAVMDIAEKNALKVYQGSFTIQDLYTCQSAFVTNSLWGVMPIAVFEKRRIGVKNKLMRLLMKEYLGLLGDGAN